MLKTVVWFRPTENGPPRFRYYNSSLASFAVSDGEARDSSVEDLVQADKEWVQSVSLIPPNLPVWVT